MVPDSALDLVDLLDLKMLPAWVNEPAQTERYAHTEGEESRERPRRHDRPHRRGKRPAQSKMVGRDRRARRLSPGDGKGRRPHDRHREDRHKVSKPIAPPIAVRFLPHPPAFESVVAQIKENSVAYSLFALAGLFLEKPTRYDVRLTAPPEWPLWQLGENGALSVDREFLDRNAFRFAQPNFYKIDITEAEPIKGNFSNVARCKLSGTLLGPTNHHDYQRRLRNLYEQRFSRRMSFADYQRQVEIVSDPALVEHWKDEARKITSFTTLREKPPATFSFAVEAERHFRQNHLPGLVRSVSESSVSGVESRHLPDRVLNRLVENEWASETRSPSRMMQELAAQFRQAGLHVFRHRRGMLFVSPVYPRGFVHDETTVSPQVRAILDAIATTPGIGRKELADKVAEEEERAKLALASDLHWLISEGYVIEFNEGSLDLPRAKAKRKPAVEAAVPAAGNGSVATAKDEKELVGSTEPRPTEEAEIGGS